MAYTTLSIFTPGSKWDGIENGSAEWGAIFQETFAILAEHGAEQVGNFFVPGMAANVSIQTYADRDTALRCQAKMIEGGYLNYQSGGEAISIEDYVGIVS
ncbi:MAG: hypothetical protein ACJ05G_06870 [Actinomycetota bacterium]|jgi:hypothetical protein|nr:hypothetical protein [Acidimicrobiales bacterium]|tara:strand:+ start:25 stop:324 length:300 start_codon:yes stop_codon:yes gene_type:complete